MLIKRLRNSLSCTHSSSRRRFLIGAGALVTAAAITSRCAFAQSIIITPERTLSLYNLHTGETLKTTYWMEGEYIPESLSDINHLLRDFRNGEIKPIDPGLLDLLHAITLRLGTSKPIQLVSGYRSPATNALLHAHSSGVAKHSLHMDGMAADIRIPGHDLRELHKVAVAMHGGGVGYYSQSDFVHVDVGHVRYWTGV
ncbi:MAG: YcbK family protein [Gallionellaceae bacterium]